MPRPDTETLVDAVVRRVKLDGRASEPLRILDVCTGSGAIAVALASVLTKAQIVASDISEGAMAVARRNVEQLKLGERVECRVGDLFAAAAGEMFDIVTANPPYIPSGDLPKLDSNVRDYEPHLALDGGADGLDLHRRILDEAPAVLSEDGRLYAEMQFDQAESLRELAAAAGWRDVEVAVDLEGRDRVLTALRPSTP